MLGQGFLTLFAQVLLEQQQAAPTPVGCATGRRDLPLPAWPHTWSPLWGQPWGSDIPRAAPQVWSIRAISSASQHLGRPPDRLQHSYSFVSDGNERCTTPPWAGHRRLGFKPLTLHFG